MAEAEDGSGAGRLAEEDVERDPAAALPENTVPISLSEEVVLRIPESCRDRLNRQAGQGILLHGFQICGMHSPHSGNQFSFLLQLEKKLSAAIEQEPNDAEYYCQRAYAYILLQNYHGAIADTKKALALDPNNSIAFLRQGIGEYYMKNYASALKFLNEGQKLNSADTSFTIWIKRCEEARNAGSQGEMQHQSQPFNIKYDWYQTESHVIVTVMIKNKKKDEVNVHFSEKELNALVKLSSEEDYNLKLQLLHPIIPEQSSFRILSTKIEIKMKKPEAIRWEKLEGDGRSKQKQFTPVSDAVLLYPSSSHYTRNWDKLVGEIKEEEKNEKLEGDAALNKLFQQIYSDGTDEVKRAMNKSFMESGGTVLSTNWSDVGKRKVEVNPPDNMEWKNF